MPPNRFRRSANVLMVETAIVARGMTVSVRFPGPSENLFSILATRGLAGKDPLFIIALLALPCAAVIL